MMTAQSSTVVVSGTREVVEAIKMKIDAAPDSQSQLVERKNLDGNAPTWFLIATVAIQALGPVVELTKSYLPQGGVKKIKVGDVEIENPSEEQVDLLLKRAKSPNGGPESE